MLHVYLLGHVGLLSSNFMPGCYDSQHVQCVVYIATTVVPYNLSYQNMLMGFVKYFFMDCIKHNTTKENE